MGVHESVGLGLMMSGCAQAMSNVKDIPQNTAIWKNTEDRTEPQDLSDQLALEEAQGEEGKRIMEGKIKDPKYPEVDWKKMQYEHKSLSGKKKEIHYSRLCTFLKDKEKSVSRR